MGEVPEQNAEEGGGLSALRKAAESGKCRMQVSFSPEFCLILKMPLQKGSRLDGTDTDSREDQKIMQKYFEYIIMQEPEFRHVQTVSDAREAVKICGYSAIDLVLMDVQTFHNHDGLSAGKDDQGKVSIYKGIDCYFPDGSQGAGKGKKRMCRQSLV